MIFTVGHSNRAFDELVALLQEHEVQVLVDVRRYPGSRRYPHFSRASLEKALPAAGIAYLHEEGLGGRRSPVEGSPNAAWRNDQFRGYADHMATAEFGEALARVRARATAEKVAIMCAEAHPSQCHRKILADALVAAGEEVLHVFAPGRSERHALHADARVAADGSVTYPAAQLTLDSTEPGPPPGTRPTRAGSPRSSRPRSARSPRTARRP